MRSLVVSSIFAALAFAVACGSDETSSPAASDGGVDGPTDAGRRVPPKEDAAPQGPPAPPTSIAFRDRDLTEGRVHGSVRVGLADDEANVEAYALYWAADDSTLLDEIHEVPKTGTHLDIGVADVVPPSATHIAVVTVNERGEHSAPLLVGPIDDVVTYADVSAGQLARSGTSPIALIDEPGKKLLVIARNDADGLVPALFRCDLDGTSCAFVDLSAGRPASSGSELAATIDPLAGKLLVASSDGANGYRPSLFRCALDGSSCVHSDISAGQGANSAQYPAVAFDAKNNKLLVVTTNGANERRLALFRCEADGSACSYVDISAGQGIDTGIAPSVQLDETNDKLLVVTSHVQPGGKPHLFRCELDGSACTHGTLATSAFFGGGGRPATTIEGGKLLTAITDVANENRAVLFRCNIDGTSCVQKDVSGSQGPQSGWDPSIVADTARKTLFIVTANGSLDASSSLVRCALDGTACVSASFPAGEPDNAGHRPSAVMDATNGTLLVVTEKRSAPIGLPTMFSLGLH